jgi:deazaflavin-dependent oxidoreductase (nitroreductase family)
VDDAEFEYCYLTTTGRRTGRPHTIEIWFALTERRLYLLAGGGETSDWVRNLLADPIVKVRLADRELSGRASRVLDPAEDDRARSLVHDKYVTRYSGDLREWRRTALPVVVELLPD